MKFNLNMSNEKQRGLMLSELKKYFKNITLKNNLSISVSTVDNSFYIIELLKGDKPLVKYQDVIVDNKFKNLRFNFVKLQNFIDANYLFEFFEKPSIKHSYSFDKNRATKALLDKYKEIEEDSESLDFYDNDGSVLEFELEFFGAKLRIIQYLADYKTEKKIIKNKKISEFIYFNLNDNVIDITDKFYEVRMIEV